MNEIDEIEMLKKRLNVLEISVQKRWAIYGTGNGAEFLYRALQEEENLHLITYVIDRDDRVQINQEFHNISVVKLDEVIDIIDGIIIAAMDYGKVIKDRILLSLTTEQLKRIEIVDIYRDSTDSEKLEYVEFVENGILNNLDDFVNFDTDAFQRANLDTKVIAWYLPQFHQMEINNKFHGQGFTEWTNTSKAFPMFTGHYQPHIPYDVGYYDLTNIESIKRQVYLAKHYGIYGFCIHYYWFSGIRIMEKPLELLLEHKELDMPFCLDWATENWTALWDGGNKEIMLEQILEDGDEEKFMNDILPYMKDSRYIKIDGRPVLVIYRINVFEKERIKAAISNFRERAKKEGFPDLYIMTTNAFEFQEDVVEWGCDALTEFPPHGVFASMKRFRPEGYINPNYKGSIWDTRSFIKNKDYMIKHKNKKYFRSAMVSWDNTARKALSQAHIITGLNPMTFRGWLKDIVEESQRIHTKEEDIVFVNSWNEWAEGSHLEPDMKYGYAYLKIVKEVLEEVRG